MDFSHWLKSWLARHPLKEPTTIDRAGYTRQIMARVNALDRPAPAPSPVRSWLPWPRLVLAAATAAAGVALVMSTANRSTSQVAQAPAHTTLILAESPATDDQWIEQTIQLLDQLDESADVSQDASGDASENEWLKELEMLDEDDLASSS